MALNKGISMADDLAAANVNRSYQLAASSIAIFTFLLFFLYPRFLSGNVDALSYQATLIVMLIGLDIRIRGIAFGCSDAFCCSWLPA